MNIIHFDSGCYLYSPVSGTHIKSSCGMTFRYEYKPDRKRYSQDMKLVTCKKCLKKITY